MEEEIWKDVMGFEGYYLVNNFGDIMSAERIIPNKRGFDCFNEGIILKQRTRDDGYLDIGFRVNNHVYKMLSHRVVAEAFIPNPENKPYVNHKNGIKTDNSVGNLEWCTAKENTEHAINNGLTVLSFGKGEDHYKSVLKNLDIPVIREMHKNGMTNIDISNLYGCCSKTIQQVTAGKTWKHIT